MPMDSELKTWVAGLTCMTQEILLLHDHNHTRRYFQVVVDTDFSNFIPL